MVGRKKAANSAKSRASQKSGGGERKPNPVKRLFKSLGPGLITGASDDDPSGIGTYAKAGAQFGYGLLWTALFTLPLMASVQFICAKIGMVTGKGLAGVIRQHYPRAVLYPAVLGLMIANTINAGADIGAISAGVSLLVPLPLNALIVPIGFLLLVLQVWGSYQLAAKIFKWLTLSLFAYVGASFLAGPKWSEVLQGTLIPEFHFEATFLATLVAILGTTISPYLFFWQTSEEVEEEMMHGRRRLWQRKGARKAELRLAAWDVNIGMFLAIIVMYSIILATAGTLHVAGKNDIETAADAAAALRPLAGDASYLLMALGLIGSGLLAVPILTTSGSYAVCEAFGWKWGLDKELRGAKQFYIVIGASTLMGLLINFIGLNPMDALLLAAVINGFLAPPLLLIIMMIANNKAIMGERVNGPVLNVLGWVTTGIMFVAVIGLLLTWGKS